MFAYAVKKGHNIYSLKPMHPGDSAFYIFLVEMSFTSLFMIMIMHVKYDKIAVMKDGMLKNLTVVLSLYAIIGMIGKISEAGLNPTLGFTAITFQAMVAVEGEATYMKYLPSYVFGPLCGAVIAAFVTKMSMAAENRKLLNEKMSRKSNTSYS